MTAWHRRKFDVQWDGRFVPCTGTSEMTVGELIYELAKARVGFVQPPFRRNRQVFELAQSLSLCREWGTELDRRATLGELFPVEPRTQRRGLFRHQREMPVVVVLRSREEVPGD